MTTPTATYLAAAEILLDRGFHKGDVIDPTSGAVDVLGACLLADGIVPDDPTLDQARLGTAVCRHAKALAAQLSPHDAPIAATLIVTEWNDTDGRTIAEAHRLLIDVHVRHTMVAPALTRAGQHLTADRPPGIVAVLTGPLAPALAGYCADAAAEEQKRHAAVGPVPHPAARLGLLRRVLNLIGTTR